MLHKSIDKETLIPLLPFGETLRPLILASSLKGTDLKFVLQKRGIFVKNHRNDTVVPILTSILLSPQEFEILKNRQRLKENTPKTSDAKVEWNSTKTIAQAVPNELENFVRDLVSEDESYRLTGCTVKTIDPDNMVVDCEIERLDWTKDAFSSTTYHESSFSISRDPSNNIVAYRTETTVQETKDLMTKLQNSLHSHFRQEEVVSKNTPIQRILANHFFDNKSRYEFLSTFIEQSYSSLSFQRIIDIDAGIDHKLSQFPKQFSWLKNNVDEIELHGKGIHLTAITELGEQGGLIFGEIYAEFKFHYPEAKGTCVIGYGFPEHYKRPSPVEFEAKISKLTLHASYSHMSKKSVGRYLIQQFQENKHLIFNDFVENKKADPRKRTPGNQYYLWDIDA